MLGGVLALEEFMAAPAALRVVEPDDDPDGVDCCWVTRLTRREIGLVVEPLWGWDWFWFWLWAG